MAALLATSGAVGADDGRFASMSGAAFHPQWRPVRGPLPGEDYRSLSRQNLRIVRSALEDTVTSLGAPTAATVALGALVGLAVDDPRISLNESKTLTLQLKDTTSDSRGVFVKFEIAW